MASTPRQPAYKRLKVVSESDVVPVDTVNWLSFVIQKRDDLFEARSEEKDVRSGNWKKKYEETNVVYIQTNLKMDFIEIDMDGLQLMKKEVRAAIGALRKKRTFEVIKQYIED